MSTRNVTITSKNQITLPSDYIRHLNLTGNRVLHAELQNGKIILTPQPDLSDIMRPFWGKHLVKRPLADAAIKRGVRTIAAKRARED